MRGKSFHNTMLLTALPLLALTACQPGSEQEPAATPLTLDSPVEGEITTGSRLNLNDGSRYEIVPLQLPPNQTARIALDGALQGQLAVFQDGKLVASSQAGCCTGHAGPAYVFVSNERESGGVFQIGVSGTDHTSYGPFRVTATATELRNGGRLEPSETVTGWINGVSTNPPAGVYELSITEAGPYEFTLRSNEFDAHLALTGAALALEDDDGAGGSDARLTAYLEPGVYQLKAASLEGHGTGQYTLSGTRSRPPAGTTFQNGGTLALNTEVHGIFTRSPVQYDVQLEERRRLVVSMQSEQIDSYLSIQGNGIHLEDDDSGNQRDARIDTTLEPGTYRISARAVDNRGGMFTVSTQSLEAHAQGGGDISVGHADAAHLSQGGIDTYRLTVEQAGSYVIYMGSDQFDALLKIQGNGIEQLDDDGGNRYDARLALDLEPGIYTVSAASANNGGGAYHLRVE